MINNVGARSITFAIAKPFLANITHYNTTRIMDAAILACMWWQIFAVIALFIFFLKLEIVQIFHCSSKLRINRVQPICLKMTTDYKKNFKVSTGRISYLMFSH
jgi:hypothetical protein